MTSPTEDEAVRARRERLEELLHLPAGKRPLAAVGSSGEPSSSSKRAKSEKRKEKKKRKKEKRVEEASRASPRESAPLASPSPARDPISPQKGTSSAGLQELLGDLGLDVSTGTPPPGDLGTGDLGNSPRRSSPLEILPSPAHPPADPALHPPTSSAVPETPLLVPSSSTAPEIAPLDTAPVRKGQTVRLNLGGGRSVSGVDSPRGLSTTEGVTPSPSSMTTMPGTVVVLPPLASIPLRAGELPPPPPLPPGSLPPGTVRADPPAHSGELPRVRGEGQYSHLFSYRGGERPSGSRLPASEVVPSRRTSPPLPRRSPLEKGRGSHSGRHHSSHHPPSPRREHTSYRDRSRSPARPGRTTPGSILLGAIGLPLRDYQEKNARAILDLEAEFSQLAVSEPHRRLSSLETRMVKAESFEATMVSMEMFLAMDRRVKQLEHYCELQRQEIAVLRASMGSVGRLQRMDENIRKSDDALAAAMEYNRRARDLGYTGRHAPISDRRGEGPAL